MAVETLDLPEGTKLSFLLRVCFGISQVRLNSRITDNYRRILHHLLESLKNDPEKQALYLSLCRTVAIYKNMAKALEQQQVLKNELQRLRDLGLPPKTIDRRLKMGWVDDCINRPIEALMDSIDQAMESSQELRSEELVACNQALADLLTQLHPPKKKRRSSRKELEELEESSNRGQ